MTLGKRISERQSRRERQSMQVPEWGENGVAEVIYFGEITVQDLNKIQRKHKDFINSMQIEGMVDLIIAKAENVDGERLFTLEDKSTLMKESVGVIGAVAGRIMGNSESFEDQEKN